MKNLSPKISLFSAPIIISALGYFVDVYDLLLFVIVKKKSVLELNGGLEERLLEDSTKILDLQMLGLLIGGIIWGILGDKKGRIKILFGSIIIYSIGNFLTSFVTNINQFAWLRFLTGIGLAGELGAGITLVIEFLPKFKRGLGTSLVAGIGLSGCVLAYFIYKITNEDWRLCFQIGGGLGIILLILRIKVSEAAIFKDVLKNEKISKGNFLSFFTNKKRFFKYLCAILIGLPTWFVIGVLVNQSDKFAEKINGAVIDSGQSIFWAYIAISLGDLLVGVICQYFKSRKKALLLYYIISIISICLFFTPSINNSAAATYFICGLLGFSTGFWAIFITMGGEQFGTNLRATAATTIPNFVRGSTYGINFLFLTTFQHAWHWNIIKSAIITGIIVYIITLIAFYFTEETYNKELDYTE